MDLARTITTGHDDERFYQMGQTCKTCNHPDVANINKRLGMNNAYLRIATDFGLSEASVRRHAKVHVQKAIEIAKKQAEAALVNYVSHFQEAVHLPIIEKIKWLQERILTDLQSATTISERVPLYREFRGALQEQAKVSGDYQQNAPKEVTREMLVNRAAERLMGDYNWSSEKARSAAVELFPPDEISYAIN